MNVKMSEFLTKQKKTVKKLVKKLSKHFKYVSVLGTDTTGKSYRVNYSGVSIDDSMFVERGFVVRVYNGINYSEYSFNEISKKNLSDIVNKILTKTTIPNGLNQMEEIKVAKYPLIEEEKVKERYFAPLSSESVQYGPKEIIDKLSNIINQAKDYNENVVNFNAGYEETHVSKLFISNNKELEQSYIWCVGQLVAMARKEQDMKYYYDSYSSLEPGLLLSKMDSVFKETIDTAMNMFNAKKVEPGVYDVICTPEITGLIAHEAFGHGVEMDMFVKERAKAVEYLGKEVASDLVTMHDGAQAAMEVSSYLFDDEGVLGSDTVIIKDGILERGISDSLSALRLGTKPTGNGKRQSYERKAYSRMTNTFFEAGNDKVEDMIKSIKKGYLITGMMSGMEDPKNWGIQCVALIGKEIIDGEFTGNLISPVYMTGYVPDLLKSISMVSDGTEMFGSGICGKGYKEYVKASDGGPYIKARVRLG